MLGLDLFGEAWVSQRKKGKRKGSSSFPTCGWDYWKIDRRLNSADNLVDLDKWSITTSLAHPLFVTLDSEHTDFCSLEALFISTWTIQLVSYSIFRFLPLFSQSQQNQLKWLLSVPGTQELAGCFPGLFGCSYYMDLGTFWYRGWPCWSHGSAVDDGSRYSNWKVSHGVRWCQTFSHTKKTRRQSRVGSRLYVFSLSLEASLNHMFFPQKTSQLPAWQAWIFFGSSRPWEQCVSGRHFLDRETWRARRSLNCLSYRFIVMDSHGFIWLSSTKVDIHMPEDDFNAKDSRVETFRTWCHCDWIRGISWGLIRLARAVRLRPEFKEMWALMKGLTESGETLLLGRKRRNFKAW